MKNPAPLVICHKLNLQPFLGAFTRYGYADLPTGPADVTTGHGRWEHKVLERAPTLLYAGH